MKKFLLVLLLTLSMTCLFAGEFNVSLGAGYGYKSMKAAELKEDGIDLGIFSQIKGLDAQVGVNYVFDNNLYVFGDFSMMFPKEQRFKLKANTGSLDKEIIDLLKSKSRPIKDMIEGGEIEKPEEAIPEGVELSTGLTAANLEKLLEIVGTGLGLDVKDTKGKQLAMAFTVGAGYRFKLNDSFSLLTGAGFRFDNNIIKGSITDDDNDKYEGKISVTTLGLGLDLEGYYYFSDNFGMMLGLKPNMGLYTNCKVSLPENIEDDEKIINEYCVSGFKPTFTFNAVAGVVVRF